MAHALAGYPVVIEIPVAWGEMDAFGHVNNIVYFRYFESARLAYFARLGLTDHGGDGPGRILASTSCRFRAPLVYPDSLRVGARVARVDRDRFTMAHLVFSQSLQKVAAEGEAVVVTYDYRLRAKVDVPPALRDAIAALEGELPGGEPA